MKYMRMDELVAESCLSRWTLMRALQEGALHGGQRKKRGTWVVEEQCFRAWMLDETCEHRKATAAA